MSETIVIVGNGMVGHKFIELLLQHGAEEHYHLVTFCEELVVKYLDRFLMFYIRTADRLQRTAPWLNNLEGGIDYLKQVVIDDKLGIGAELERDMQNVVDTYQCEWQTTIREDGKIKRFRHFINTDQPDPNIVMVKERGQKRPAYAGEREPLIPIDLVSVR